MKQTGAIVEGLLEDGAMMREVRSVIAAHLSDSRGLAIADESAGLHQFSVYRVEDFTERLHTSASYTSCLEFALRQPYQEKR